jgi:hypothetical protein
MRCLVLWTLFALVVAGCGPSSQEAELKKGGAEIPSWPGLSAVTSQDVLRPVVMGAAMGNFTAVKEQAADPKFQEAVAKFEKESIPGKFSTPEREAARTDAIKHFKALIEGAKGSASDEELKASVEGANKAIISLTTPKT